MGLLVDGRWQDQWYDTKSSGGSFERTTTRFRRWVTASGLAGEGGSDSVKAEAGRFHLYVSLACPWAHRTIIARRLKKLEDAVSLSIVDWHMGEEGWVFSERDGAIPDTVNGASRLYEIYQRADPHYSGRVTVPVLWDRQEKTIVNNESAEILRILDSAFDAWGDPTVRLSPPDLRAEIDAINDCIYESVNNGVYKCGFATTQEAYEAPFRALFERLDEIEDRLSRQRWLVGAQAPTEADWRLFTTLVRFDAVYVGHFKCNKRRIADYPNLSGYLRDLYQWPGIAETVDFTHIKGHYYTSHPTINPTRVVPLGPDQDLSEPHDRARLD